MLGGPAAAPCSPLSTVMSPVPGMSDRCQPSNFSPLGAIRIIARSDDAAVTSAKWRGKCQ
jgi:hypothetical protein